VGKDNELFIIDRQVGDFHHLYDGPAMCRCHSSSSGMSAPPGSSSHSFVLTHIPARPFLQRAGSCAALPKFRLSPVPQVTAKIAVHRYCRLAIGWPIRRFDGEDHEQEQ
jgi:hypothetical protein